jgi:DNA-binding PadR family transcriptional regulator
MFEKGELKYLFLDLLREKPRHGYDLIRAIEERSGGRYAASPGAVYPILQMLEDQGYVEAERADGRKTYRITPAGEAFLQENAATVEEIHRRIAGAWDHHGLHGEWAGMLHELAHCGRVFGRLQKVRHMRPETTRKVLAILERARRELEQVLEEERA